MKLNKKTQRLLDNFQVGVELVEKEMHVGCFGDGKQRAEDELDRCEKLLKEHLFKLEERLRKYKKWWYRAKAEIV